MAPDSRHSDMFSRCHGTAGTLTVLRKQGNAEIPGRGLSKAWCTWSPSGARSGEVTAVQ